MCGGWFDVSVQENTFLLCFALDASSPASSGTVQKKSGEMMLFFPPQKNSQAALEASMPLLECGSHCDRDVTPGLTAPKIVGDGAARNGDHTSTFWCCHTRCHISVTMGPTLEARDVCILKGASWRGFPPFHVCTAWSVFEKRKFVFFVPLFCTGPLLARGASQVGAGAFFVQVSTHECTDE